MALSTYADLKTAIANWLDRSDLTSYLDDFIDLAETRLSRDLRIRQMETQGTQTLTSGTREYSLPTNYLQMRNMQLNTAPITSLEYLTPEMMDRLWAGSSSGRPRAYTIIRDKIQLGPSPDSAYTLEYTYYAKPSALTASENGLLSVIPDVYLYACLLEAEPFLQNDQRIQLWMAAYDKAVAAAQMSDEKDRHSGSAMRVMTETGYP
jgi:hypothetical protein